MVADQRLSTGAETSRGVPACRTIMNVRPTEEVLVYVEHRIEASPTR